MKSYLTLVFALAFMMPILNAQDKVENPFTQLVDEKADEIEQKVIEWRRHFHENPELSNREFKTSEYIAKYLKDLGLEVKTRRCQNGRSCLIERRKTRGIVALRCRY